MLRKLAVGAAAVAFAGGIALAGTAGAAGGNGRSLCSGSSAPDGVVDVNNQATWNNAGEVISSIAPEQVKPGQVVKGLCNPNLSPT
jgi:hypothetical protein